jgi:hypothetical protein
MTTYFLDEQVGFLNAKDARQQADPASAAGVCSGMDEGVQQVEHNDLYSWPWCAHNHKLRATTPAPRRTRST